jgi:hypothetical protein
MAVIVSDSRNVNYDTYLATANSFYRAEAWNLGSSSQTALALSTIRTEAVTFANAGNCQGVILALYSISTTLDHSVTTRLQEGITISSFNTSTERVNITGHGLADGTPVAFTSTGTLPTGITANTIYFVVNQTANDFQIEASVGGGVIGLSGTPTGTATCWADRASKVLTVTDIMGTLPTSTAGLEKYPMFNSFVPFDFATPYAVDTVAGKWRFHMAQTGGTIGTWHLLTSNATNPFYVTWCDTAISHVDNDVLIVKDRVIIDKTATLRGLTSTGYTAEATAGIVCRTTYYTIDNGALLQWHPTPAAAYTFTLDGMIYYGSHAGMRIGTSSVPIPNAQKATISFLTPTNGTAVVSQIKMIEGASSSTSIFAGKASIFAYGEVPARIATTLASDAVIGQPNLVCTDDITSWQAGDIVIAGKQAVMGQGVTTATVLSSVSGSNTAILTANLATNNRLAGGTVVNFSGGFGIYFTGATNAGISVTTHGVTLGTPSNFVFKGCSFLNAYAFTVTKNHYYAIDDAPYRSQHLIEDCTHRLTGTTLTFFHGGPIPKDGKLMQRCYSFRSTLHVTAAGYLNSSLKSGYFRFYDNVCISNDINIHFSATGQVQLDCQRNKFENSNRYGVAVGGLNLILKDNYFYGILGTPASNYYAAQIGTTIFADIQNNVYDRCGTAIQFAAAPTKECFDTNSSFGPTVANTVDIRVLGGAIIDYTVKDTVNLTTLDFSQMPDAVAGSELRFLNFNSATNADRVIVPEGKFIRCGFGLSDTTVWTGSAFGVASAGQFALRMIPDLNSSSPISYGQIKTTGDIQGKLMTVSARVMIKNANYYAGTATNPTLRVVYDGGTEVTSVALNNTNAQLLQVSFTPTTNAGAISVYIEGATDAVEADAEFYLGEVLIPLPEGVAVDTTKLSIWDKAMPLDSISTFESPDSAWNAISSAYVTPGTMGSKMNNASNKASLAASLSA